MAYRRIELLPNRWAHRRRTTVIHYWQPGWHCGRGQAMRHCASDETKVTCKPCLQRLGNIRKDRARAYG